MKKFSLRRNLILGFVASCVGLGAVASAVNLGISSNNQMGAGLSVTASCQPSTGAAITVGFNAPTYSSTLSDYAITTVNLASVNAACSGKTVKITALDSSGNSLATYSGTIAATTVTGTLSTSVAAGSVANVAVVIW